MAIDAALVLARTCGQPGKVFPSPSSASPPGWWTLLKEVTWVQSNPSKVVPHAGAPSHGKCCCGCQKSMWAQRKKITYRTERHPGTPNTWKSPWLTKSPNWKYFGCGNTCKRPSQCSLPSTVPNTPSYLTQPLLSTLRLCSPLHSKNQSILQTTKLMFTCLVF